MAETNLEKFKRLLRELFMFDQADLDFGIYRIMNSKRDEITGFLENDLLPQVHKALGELAAVDHAALEADLARAIEQAKALGVDPESAQKVRDLRQRLAQTADLVAIENEIFSDLYAFFRRYYSEGDFLSLRRYKEGVYAIPYEGEEVKLYWANADQYYIKTAEYFRDYAFKLTDGRRVHFKLIAADSLQHNNVQATGQERRFILHEGDPITEENGDLVVRFEYRPDPEKRKQTDLNAESGKTILNADKVVGWLAELAVPAPTEKNPNRTLLDRYLADYTARNTFDYFIHKDLGAFLRRELDFFIKNEVMHLDDVESEAAARVEQYLARIKAIRVIANKLIDFLAQLEDFQKKLWLKRKFVVETNYCVTLDRISEALYPEIASNEAQREEWVRLFAIDAIKPDLTRTAEYSNPLTVEFLKENPFLVVDTKHFSADFVDKLLHDVRDLDTELDGLLIRSDNFHALVLLGARYGDLVDAIYIDPPYNTDASAILYKNDYKDSSWLALLDSRSTLSKDLLTDTGVLCVAIDDVEFARLKLLLVQLYGSPQILGTAAVRSNPAGRSTPTGFSVAHDYAIFVGRSGSATVGRLQRSEKQLARYDQRDDTSSFEWVNFRKHGGAEASRAARPRMFFPIFAHDGSIRIPEMEWIPSRREWELKETPRSGEEVIWPVNSEGQERRWKWGFESVKTALEDFCSKPEQGGKTGVFFKARMKGEGMLPVTWWDKKEYSATEYGTNFLTDMLGDVGAFSFPKSIYLVEDCLRVSCTKEDGLIVDYFAGSGTTGHAVINLNREDGGKRKFIMAEMGEYFDSVLLPRMKKAVYSKEWKASKPVSREGVSHMMKYIRLESYEDSLNNVELKRTREQAELLGLHAQVREDYILRYMLDVESRSSTSRLNLDYVEDPFNYKLLIAMASAGETRSVNVDLVETFNWLLGLRVKQIDAIRGFRVVQGTNPADDKVLIIWRNTREKSTSELDEFFVKQKYNTRDMEFDLIYVNGDNNLENLRRPDETWKVRLIEEEFKRLMFDVRDV